MNKKTGETVLHIILLTAIYCSAHWFLLILSGRWRDDWVNITGNQVVSAELKMMLGSPLLEITNLPRKFIGHRPLSFVFFLIGGFLVYYILRTLDFLSSREAFWLSSLYMVIPINDARVFGSCYKYSAGLFLFWVAFALTAVWAGIRGSVSYILRIITWGILVLSYNTESILLFTLLIALYLYYFETKDKISRKNVLKTNAGYVL